MTMNTTIRQTLVAAALCMSWTAPALQAQQGSITHELQQMTAQWLALTHQEQSVKRQWAQEKQQLEMRLEILKDEQKTLQSALASEDDNTDELDEARSELLSQQDTLEQSQATMAEYNRKLGAEISALLPRLPPALADSARNTLAKVTAAASASEALEQYLALYTELHNVQQLIRTSSGVIRTTTGAEHFVTQLYLGTTHAWYSSADGTYRGIGRMTEDTWEWQDLPTVDAEAVQAAVTMLARQDRIDLIRLPVSLTPARQQTQAAGDSND